MTECLTNKVECDGLQVSSTTGVANDMAMAGKLWQEGERLIADALAGTLTAAPAASNSR